MAKRYKERRIIGGVLHHVMTENGKIVEDLGPVKKDQPSIETKPQVNTSEEQKPTTGLKLITDDDDIPPPPGIGPGHKPGIKLTPIQVAKSGKKPTWEDILSKIPEPDPDRQVTETPNQIDTTKVLEPPSQVPVPIPPKIPVLESPSQVPVLESPSEVPVLEPSPSVPVLEPSPSVPVLGPAPTVPVLEPLKPPQIIPEIKIPKIQINVPQEKHEKQEKQEKQIPGISNISNKLGDMLGNINTYPEHKETKVVGTNIQKADEIRPQQLEANIEKSKPKEKRRSMAEELEAELLNERKFEEWLKKQKFRENLEKAARFAEETKVQFEEKIPELSTKIEGITDEVKGVENRLGTVDKSVGDLCTGVDCIKTDVKNYQENVKKYQESHEELEKMVQDRFKELGEKVQSLEHPLFTCENCGEQAISPLSSYCPNCGSPIHSWSDESGEPIRGWTPYWKRIGRETPQ